MLDELKLLFEETKTYLKRWLTQKGSTCYDEDEKLNRNYEVWKIIQ